MWRQKARIAGRVALEDDLEGGLAAALDLPDEPVVADQAQQAAGAQGTARGDVQRPSGTTHMNAVDTRRFAHNSRTSSGRQALKGHEDISR